MREHARARASRDTLPHLRDPVLHLGDQSFRALGHAGRAADVADAPEDGIEIWASSVRTRAPATASRTCRSGGGNVGGAGGGGTSQDTLRQHEIGLQRGESFHIDFVDAAVIAHRRANRDRRFRHSTSLRDSCAVVTAAAGAFTLGG